MKLALYSAVYGTYEATAKPLPPDLGIPALMFTDNRDVARQAPAAGWQAILTNEPYGKFDPDPANGDPAIVRPMLAHKYWKTHPVEAILHAATAVNPELHDVDTTIWVDGNMRITMAGPEWVARNVAALGDDEWSLMAHPWRSTVREEHEYTAAVCAGRYSVEAMQRLTDGLFNPATAYPDDVGLFASGHMVRRHALGVVIACRDWWAMNVAFTHQDQLSLPFVIRKHAPRWNADLPWAMWSLDPHGT